MNNILKLVIGVLCLSGILAIIATSITPLTSGVSSPQPGVTPIATDTKIAPAPFPGPAPETKKSSFVTDTNEQSYAQFGQPMVDPKPVGDFAPKEESPQSGTQPGTPEGDAAQTDTKPDGSPPS